LQGRTGDAFDDSNAGLIEALLAAHPAATTLQMETFHLLDLARCSSGSVRAAAVCIAAAERYSNRFISRQLMVERERQGGAAALTALVRCPLEGVAGAASAGEQHQHQQQQQQMQMSPPAAQKRTAAVTAPMD
jgi:hypothetical protein